MRRDSFVLRIQKWPRLRLVLHECWACHAFGIRPGILDTRVGDYGLREYARERYQDLTLSPEGLCSACADDSSPKMSDET